jgi:glycosyltransferase involved in cell wall biosynthesis
MRILQVHPLLRGDGIYPLAGGKARVSAGLSEYLALAGQSVALFPYPERLFLPPRDFRGAQGGQIEVLSTATLPTRNEILSDLVALARARVAARRPRGDNGGFDLLALTALRRALEEYRPDIVHCQHTFSDFPFLYRALRAKPPLILTHHAYQPSSDLSLYDWVVFVSDDWRKRITRTSRYRLERTRVIYNPVSSVFATGQVKKREERKGVVFSGNLSRRKGLHLLIQAYHESPPLSAHPLTVCGTGEEEAACRELALRYGVPVTFRGRLAADALREVLSAAAALVNPSSSEGFSVALLEGACCGTPVVGYPAQLEEMQSVLGMRVGRPFDAMRQSPLELASAALQILEGTAYELPEPGTLAARARDAFSMSRAGEALLKLYTEAVRE